MAETQAERTDLAWSRTSAWLVALTLLFLHPTGTGPDPVASVCAAAAAATAVWIRTTRRGRRHRSRIGLDAGVRPAEVRAVGLVSVALCVLVAGAALEVGLR